ncbi:unnamed protein product, partial [Ectocarpus sp. 4 AP-2014]
DSPFFSLSRQELIRSEYLSLCGESRWGVGQEALRRYRREVDVRAVGTVRAPRVIHAGHRPPWSSFLCSSASSSSPPSFSCSSSSSSCSSSSSSSSLFSTGSARRRETLGYDAWVCFWLCEEALQSGTCSRRDVRYCFALLDEGNLGRVGVREVEPFIEDTLSSGRSEDVSSATETAFARFQDSLGVKRTSDYISLQDVTKPANVKRAGRFFGYLFLGIDLDNDHDDDDRGPEGGVGIAGTAGTGTVTGASSGAHIRARECALPSRPSRPLASLPGDRCPASKPAPSPPPALPPPPQQQQQQHPSRLPSLESSIRNIKAKLRVTAFSKSLSPTRPLLPTPPLTPPAPTPPRASPSPLSALSPPWVMPTSASPPPKQQQQLQQQQQQQQQRQQKQQQKQHQKHKQKQKQ